MVEASWLVSARERRAEAVVRLAEEFECGSPCVRAELSPLFFRALVTAHLVQNDTVRATWALRRWAAVLAGGDEPQDRVRASLERTAHHCGRHAYGEAFREAAGASGGGGGEDAALLECWALDHLAARHVHQRQTFYGDAGGLDRVAAELGVTSADLELRLRRVREDELRRLECAAEDSPGERARAMVRCMMLAGQAM